MTQPLTALQLSMLHADLHHLRVANRDQGGRKLSYLEAYDVRATLIRIFGYGGFSAETLETRIAHESTYTPRDQDRELWRIGVICTFRLTIHQTGAVYTETAAASQSGPDYGEVLDFAIKTAESDALKRCATNLGTTFGLSLYDNGKLQDVVRAVYAPGQWDVVADLKVARSGDGEDAAAARARMQARLKTGNPAGQGSSSGSSAAEGSPEPAGETSDAPAAEPTVAADEPVVEPVSGATEPPEADVPPDPNEAVPAAKDHVKQAAADLARVVAGKPPRAPRTRAAAAVAS
jgi:hypothetical protein